MASKDQWHEARAAELHKSGAARFGWSWIGANELVTTAARKAGSGEFTGRDKHMLSAVAHAICEQEEQRNMDSKGDALDRGE